MQMFSAIFIKDIRPNWARNVFNFYMNKAFFITFLLNSSAVCTIGTWLKINPEEKKTHLKSHLYYFVPVYVPPVWQIESFEVKQTHFGGVHTSTGCWCRTCVICLSSNIYHINVSARSGVTFVFRATVFTRAYWGLCTEKRIHSITQHCQHVWSFMFQAGV